MTGPNPTPDIPGKPGGPYFPLRFIVDFLRFLDRNRDRIEVLTYSDLEWENDYDYTQSYPEEWKCWRRALKSGIRDPHKVYVILQHDVDSAPHRTLQMAQEEASLGIPSTLMVFRERIDRRQYQATGELKQTPYDIDPPRLQKLEQDHRFLVGYHSNTLERAEFDNARASQLFEEDVAELRKQFDIRFFSPHGGARGPDGQTNNALDVPGSLKESVRWVANRYTLKLNGTYSDGGINSPSRDPRSRDLRDFVRSWKPGNRYRVLLHPQYYDSNWGRSPRLAGTAWYEEVLGLCSVSENAWAGVELRE